MSLNQERNKLKKSIKHTNKIVQKLRQKKGQRMVSLKGSGDYIPSSFSRVKGKGGYISDGLSSLGSSAGNFIGNSLGGLVEKGLSSFASLLGFGDYREASAASQGVYEKGGHAALMGLLSNPDPMKMGAMNAQFNGGPPRIRHREFIGDVLGSAGFKTTVYPIQPGLRSQNSLFPWCSSVAQCFQQYRLHGAILEYVSTSTDYAAYTSLGSVMMSTVYDAEAAPLSDELAVNNNEYTTFQKPSMSFIHPIECASSDNPMTLRYIRSSNSIEATSDERFSDIGKFQVSTNGNGAADGQVIGQLWITYDIEFQKPSLPDRHNGTTFSWVADQHQVSHLNPGNSLPCELGWTGTDIIIGLPVGYAGAFLVNAQCLIPASAYLTAHFTNGWVVPYVGPVPDFGSDVTVLNSWVDANGAATFAQAGEGGSGGNPVQANISLLITTIAHSTNDNYFKLRYPVVYGPTTPNFPLYNITITAVDSDLVPYAPPAAAAITSSIERYLLDNGMITTKQLSRRQTTTNIGTVKNFPFKELKEEKEEEYGTIKPFPLKPIGSELDDVPECDSSSASSTPPVELSSSMVGVIGDYLARKSQKK